MLEKNNKLRDEKITEVLKQIQDAKVKYCWLQFTDINGILKSFGVASSRMAEILESGASFDGSSVTGYGQVQESDMVALPDPSTFAVIPWRSPEYPVARFLCDLYNVDGTRFDGDPRYILQKAMKKASNMGFQMKTAPELEFFLLKENGSNVPTTSDIKGYFDADYSDEAHMIHREIGEYAAKFPDVMVETVHHEGARSQHEVDIKYASAGEIADACITMKMIIKVVAARRNYLATFMPKPWQGHNGSGMHVHMSLWDQTEKNNLFFDDKSPNKLSQLMLYWIGGQLTYAKEMTAILNSWPNSYKRLIPGFEAPTYISWGFKNRSMLIRVPNFFSKANAARCEIRSPDPAGNIYLQLAALLTTGLEGIKRKISPPAPNELNVYHISEEEKIKLGIETLPESLGQALYAFRHSELMKEMMGVSGYKCFIDAKMQENTQYNTHVSEWELNRYSQVL